MRIKGYICLFMVCCFYWILDSIWSYLSFELNLRKLIFSEPASYLDTFLLQVPPYQVVSRIMVLVLFAVSGALIIEYFIKKHTAERAIRESEEKYRSIYENALVAIFRRSIDQERVTAVNNVGVRMFGYNSKEEFLEKFTSIDHYAHPNDREELLAKVNSKGEVHNKHFQFKRKDGSFFWGEISARMDRKKREIEAVILDISERKQAEEEIRKNKIFLETLINSIPSPVFYKDNDGKYLGFNSAFEEFFGETKENLIGKSVFDINPLELAKIYHSKDQELLDSGILQTYESQVKDAKGQLRDVVFHKSIFGDTEGNTIGLIGSIIDITDRKRYEISLRESEKKFRTLFNISPLAITITEVESGRIIDANNKFTEMSKYSKDELIGKNPIELGLYEKEKREQFRDLIQAKGSVNGLEQEFAIKSGLKITTLMFATKIQLFEVPYILTIYLDITDKKRLENDLIQAHKMEAIGTLAGGIAHDFNNILSSVIGFTELALEDVEKDSMIEDNLQEVYTAGKRAKELVGQILAFARQSEEKLKPIQVDIIIKEVLQFIRSSIPTTIEIKKKINSNSIIMGNQTQVHQIMMNLCTNAAHAMEDEGGVLEVDLKDVVLDKSSTEKLDLKSGNYIVLTVSDTGVGIPPDIIDSIFEPYFTTKGLGDGTGMGLAMVQGIIESYNGKIKVNSIPGKATTFTIYLPVTKKRKTQRQYESEQLPTGTERILFVDDEAPIAKMGSQGLERLGYKVETRTSSVEALELFRSKPDEFDLIITDMTMPNMTGDKLAEETIKIRPDIPVILCTGYSKKISDENASDIGIKSFAYKPIIKADLAKTVRKVLDEANGIEK